MAGKQSNGEHLKCGRTDEFSKVAGYKSSIEKPAPFLYTNKSYPKKKLKNQPHLQ